MCSTAAAKSSALQAALQACGAEPCPEAFTDQAQESSVAQENQGTEAGEAGQPSHRTPVASPLTPVFRRESEPLSM